MLAVLGCESGMAMDVRNGTTVPIHFYRLPAAPGSTFRWIAPGVEYPGSKAALLQPGAVYHWIEWVAPNEIATYDRVIFATGPHKVLFCRRIRPGDVDRGHSTASIVV